MPQRLKRAFSFGRAVPDDAARDAERAALLLRMQTGSVRLDDIKRLHALDDLIGHWSTKPFRLLMYKLGCEDD